MRGTVAVLAAVAGLALGIAPQAGADYTATHSTGVAGGSDTIGNVVFSGNADSDLLQIRLNTANGRLFHNRFSQGDAGFTSEFDFDSTLGGEQRLTNNAASAISANAGDGVDALWVFESAPAVQVPVTFDGGAETDSIATFNSSGSPQSITLNASTINGVFASQITYASVEFGSLGTAENASANDTFEVTASPAAPLTIFAGPGNDTLELANNMALGESYLGEEGTDTLDYSAWSAPVSANLGAQASFEATLNQAQETPPTGSTATGTGAVFFTDTATNTFDYSLTVSGLTAAQITDAHIHGGAPGVDGPPIFDIGPGTTWSNPATPRDIGENLTDPDITEPALRDGNTYFNVHTALNPDGEIRGRIQLDPRGGYSGPATGMGTGDALTIENVIGGSGADTLTGNPMPNRFESGSGDDTLNAADGVADAVLDCGPGANDVLNRDPAAIDADSVVSGCETVNPPLTPVTPPPDGGGGGGDGGGGDGAGGDGGGGGGGDTPRDSDPPEGAIRKVKVNGDDVKVTFRSDEPGSTFACKLDKKPYKRCTSPKTYRNLKEGKHKILVRATDAAGNVDSTPAKAKFEV